MNAEGLDKLAERLERRFQRFGFGQFASDSMSLSAWFGITATGFGVGSGILIGVFLGVLRFAFGIDRIPAVLPFAILYMVLIVVVMYAVSALLAIPIGVILRVGLNRLNRADDIRARNELLDIIDEVASIEELPEQARRDLTSLKLRAEQASAPQGKVTRRFWQWNFKGRG